MEEIQRSLAAISEPTRFQIVELLGSGQRCVGSIAVSLNVGQPQVSRHLRLLAEAGVVEAAKQGQKRLYSLRPSAMQELCDWTQRLVTQWTERMDRLGSLIESTEQ